MGATAARISMVVSRVYGRVWPAKRSGEHTGGAPLLSRDKTFSQNSHSIRSSAAKPLIKSVLALSG